MAASPTKQNPTNLDRGKIIRDPSGLKLQILRTAVPSILRDSSYLQISPYCNWNR